MNVVEHFCKDLRRIVGDTKLQTDKDITLELGIHIGGLRLWTKESCPLVLRAILYDKRGKALLESSFRGTLLRGDNEENLAKIKRRRAIFEKYLRDSFPTLKIELREFQYMF